MNSRSTRETAILISLSSLLVIAAIYTYAAFDYFEYRRSEIRSQQQGQQEFATSSPTELPSVNITSSAMSPTPKVNKSSPESIITTSTKPSANTVPAITNTQTPSIL